MLLGGSAPPSKPAEAKKEAPAPQAKDQKKEDLPALLLRRMNFDGFDDPKLTLEGALEYLADPKQFGVSFYVQEIAFRDAGYADKNVKDEPIATRPIPKMTNARGETVLRAILARVPTTPSREATFLIRKDGIEITTASLVEAEVWSPDYRGPHLPLVHPRFDRRPLGEALKELATAADYNIMLDPRTEEKAKTSVSANMTNAPLDTAVRFLADFAELEPVFLDNVILVTTKENAAAWQKKLEKEQKDRMKDDAVRPRVGSRGLPTAPGAVPPQNVN
jgi:hypothetical protein